VTVTFTVRGQEAHSNDLIYAAHTLTHTLTQTTGRIGYHK